MINLFLSKKIIIPAVIIFSGLVIAFGVLTLANFSVVKLSVASNSLQWTQQTGAGISAPACGSASASSPTCFNGLPSVNFDWALDLTLHNVDWVQLSISEGPTLVFNSAICGTVDVPGSCAQTSGSYTWTGGKNNTAYTWTIATPQDGPIGSGSFLTTNCAPPPPTASLSANPTTIAKGQSSTLSWTSTNATSCSIDQGIGSVATSSVGLLVYPSKDTTYTLTCSGSTPPPATSQATVTVLPPGNFQLTGSASACNAINLSWTPSTGADGYRIYRGAPRVDITPYNPYTALSFVDTNVNQNTTYKYQLDAYNNSGTKSSNTENITTPYCPPTLNFSGFPTSIFEGQNSTLTWSTTYVNPNGCTASSAPNQINWSGSKAANGSQVVFPSPPPSVIYTLSCVGPGGSTGSQSVVVNITSLALPEWKEIIPR